MTRQPSDPVPWKPGDPDRRAPEPDRVYVEQPGDYSADVPAWVRRDTSTAPTRETPALSFASIIPLQRLIRTALLNALAVTEGDQRHAAQLLGISDRVMNYQMQKYGIPRARTGSG